MPVREWYRGALPLSVARWPGRVPHLLLAARDIGRPAAAQGVV